MKTILITGATGYIGKRLKDRLLKRDDITIRLLVRNKSKLRSSVPDKVVVFEGDTFNKDVLLEALNGVEIAYYLIHSMGSGQDFEELDRKSAENFRDACIEQGVKRVVYLGGLGVKKSASKHLLSRIETGQILSSLSDKLQCIWFRAGAIIGSGSASFEIIRHLVEKLPVMITPKWVHTRTQPIAVDDVLSYLEGAISLPVQENLVVDIGTDPLNFREMLLGASKILGLKRILITVPVLTPKLSSYWLLLITSVPFSIASALVDGLKSETVVLNDNAEKYFPHVIPMSYAKAVQTAIQEMEQDSVISK